MEMLQYFLECYFHMAAKYKNLDNIIKKFKDAESKDIYVKFISELNLIIENKLYEKASYFIKQHGCRRLSFKKTELLLNYIYNKLCNIPSDIKTTDLK